MVRREIAALTELLMSSSQLVHGTLGYIKHAYEAQDLLLSSVNGELVKVTKRFNMDALVDACPHEVSGGGGGFWPHRNTCALPVDPDGAPQQFGMFEESALQKLPIKDGELGSCADLAPALGVMAPEVLGLD